MAVAAAPALSAPVVTMKKISTDFRSPIGIDYYEPTKELILSANYPTGTPHNLEIVAGDGTHTGYSSLSGLTDELKIATVRSGYTTGFAVGTVFTGNGLDGEIVKVDPGGGTVSNPWVTLPGTGHGLLRGSLYVDRTGIYGGDLLVVTTGGELWRINSAGTPTKIDDVDVHLEGLVTVPDIKAKWGDIAGCIIAGAEEQALMHSWCPTAAGGFVHKTRTLGAGIRIEDLDFIDGGNFFGVNFGTSQLVGAAAADFASMVGDILVTQEFPSTGTGLHHMFWDGTTLVTEELLFAAGSTSTGQWEHVTFADAGVVEIPPVGTPIPGSLWLAGLGLVLLGLGRTQRG